MYHWLLLHKECIVLDQYPTDHFFWEFLAYCSGTGGSILIIGSAAGVAAMGMERIQFGWYLKKIAWIAIIGYLAGAGSIFIATLFTEFIDHHIHIIGQYEFRLSFQILDLSSRLLIHIPNHANAACCSCFHAR